MEKSRAESKEPLPIDEVRRLQERLAEIIEKRDSMGYTRFNDPNEEEAGEILKTLLERGNYKTLEEMHTATQEILKKRKNDSDKIKE